jgi:threonine dehydratase
VLAVTEPLAIDADDVAAAAERIRADVQRTPIAVSHTLSALTGAEVVVKFENLQFTASFKDRGAANRLRTLTDDERSAGVISLSAGNHAQGVAYHAERLAIPATIVMPVTAPFAKVANTEALGAEVVQAGATFAEAGETADRIAAERGLTWVHPYDDAAVIAGQGTVAIELLDDLADLDTVIAPVGGGGLISGMATWIKAHRPDVEIVGVQTDTYPGMLRALAGEELAPSRADTIADGIAVKQPGKLTVPIVRALVDDVIAVPEHTIERAVSLYLEIEKTVAEGAGAAGLAALLHHPDRWRGKRVALVLSGGNIDTRVLASLLMREMAHSGRITTLRVAVSDTPGQLAPLVGVIAAAGANIVELEHRRLFDPISARATNIDIVVETRDHRHVERVVASLTEAGFAVTIVV